MSDMELSAKQVQQYQVDLILRQQAEMSEMLL